MNKVIQSAKGILRSKKARIFALLFILLVVALAILKSWPEPIGEYRLTEMVPGGNCYFRSLNDNGQAAGFVRRQGKECAAVWMKAPVLLF